MSRLEATERLVELGLAIHILLTFFHNSPDTKVNFGRISKYLYGLPQWRFFAPNPGVDNTHLMIRTKSQQMWSSWTELGITQQLPWYAFLWNPGGRAPKVLFDTAQQLVILAGFGTPYEVAVASDFYDLIDDMIIGASESREGVTAVQFLILTNRPSTDSELAIKPIFVSRPRSILRRAL